MAGSGDDGVVCIDAAVVLARACRMVNPARHCMLLNAAGSVKSRNEKTRRLLV